MDRKKRKLRWHLKRDGVLDALMLVSLHAMWSGAVVVVFSPYYTVPITEALLLWAKVMLVVGVIIVLTYDYEQ